MFPWIPPVSRFRTSSPRCDIVQLGGWQKICRTCAFFRDCFMMSMIKLGRRCLKSRSVSLPHRRREWKLDRYASPDSAGLPENQRKRDDGQLLAAESLAYMCWHALNTRTQICSLPDATQLPIAVADRLRGSLPLSHMLGVLWDASGKQSQQSAR